MQGQLKISMKHGQNHNESFRVKFKVRHGQNKSFKVISKLGSIKVNMRSRKTFRIVIKVKQLTIKVHVQGQTGGQNHGSLDLAKHQGLG